jgi:hypothetical protein
MTMAKSSGLSVDRVRAHADQQAAEGVEHAEQERRSPPGGRHAIMGSFLKNHFGSSQAIETALLADHRGFLPNRMGGRHLARQELPKCLISLDEGIFILAP